MKENPHSDREKLAHRTAYLIAGYIRHTLTRAEHDELDDWVNESDANMKLFEDLTDEQHIATNLERIGQVDVDAAYKRLQQQGGLKLPSKRSASRKWWAAAAAAVILSGIYIGTNVKGRAGADTLGIADSGEKPMQKDAGNVMLQLANGTAVNLSASNQGLIDLGQNVHIQKSSDSTLEYLGEGEDLMQALSTPHGKQFQVKLSDGTRVWLNTASSLQYPGRFANNERAVFVTGEAYFEVAPDSKKPFKVYMEDSSLVTVLGTHFNVSAYQNQPVKTVTLLEGTVSISPSPDGYRDGEGQGVRLNSGSQATLINGTIKKHMGIDTDEVMGWKNGLFVFKDADIKTIMEQLDLWYNVEVVYKGKINHRFNAAFPRSERLERILHLLQLTGYVNFKTENKVIYVLP
ncbi:MAG TPA: FecR domain-containing protein [Niabella sp.]|nr:FecR domain-containing protein [Niabella sp.]